MTPPEVRFDPASGRVAIKTELSETRAWFIFHPENGGFYTSGTSPQNDVSDWLPYALPSI